MGKLEKQIEEMRQVNVCPKTMLEYFRLISILEYFETQAKDIMFSKSIFVDILAKMFKTQAEEIMFSKKIFSLISLPICLKHRPRR